MQLSFYLFIFFTWKTKFLYHFGDKKNEMGVVLLWKERAGDSNKKLFIQMKMNVVRHSMLAVCGRKETKEELCTL